jgi:dipeptide/tripeptide permease
MDAAQSYTIVSWGTLVGLAVSVLVLLVLAISVRYTDFITAHPWKFAMETAAIGVFAAAPIFLVARHRDGLSFGSVAEFAILAVKFIIFWVLFELAGVNATFFADKSEKTDGDRE